MPEATPTLWGKFWALVGHIGNIQTLLGLAGASGVATWAVSMMPGGWHPPQYWFGGLFAFTAGWLTIALVSRGWVAVDRAMHPTVFRLQPHGGPEATMTLYVDSGESAPFRVSAQWIDAAGRPLGAPYDALWKMGPGREKQITPTDFRVLSLAFFASGDDAKVHLTGSEHAWSVGRIRVPARYADIEPKRVRILVYVRGRVLLEREYLIRWDGGHKKFSVETAH